MKIFENHDHRFPYDTKVCICGLSWYEFIIEQNKVTK